MSDQELLKKAAEELIVLGWWCNIPEARNATALGVNDVYKQTGMIQRPQDEADLCAHDGAPGGRT